jgi:hypothetical protein
MGIRFGEFRILAKRVRFAVTIGSDRLCPPNNRVVVIHGDLSTEPSTVAVITRGIVEIGCVRVAKLAVPKKNVIARGNRFRSVTT